MILYGRISTQRAERALCLSCISRRRGLAQAPWAPAALDDAAPALHLHKHRGICGECRDYGELVSWITPPPGDASIGVVDLAAGLADRGTRELRYELPDEILLHPITLATAICSTALVLVVVAWIFVGSLLHHVR
jgi:hypothetical protein